MSKIRVGALEVRGNSWLLVIVFQSDLLLKGFPGGSGGKEPVCQFSRQTLGWISRLERFPGEGKGYPLQYSGLENAMDCIVHGVTNGQKMTERLSVSLKYSVCQVYWYVLG